MKNNKQTRTAKKTLKKKTGEDILTLPDTEI